MMILWSAILWLTEQLSCIVASSAAGRRRATDDWDDDDDSEVGNNFYVRSHNAHFLRTWAATHRLGPHCKKAVAAVMDVPPLFDRGVVPDDGGLREAFLCDHRALGAAGDKRLDDWDLSRRPGVVVVTFRFTDKQLRALRRNVESETSARCSPFALACGAACVGIVRAPAGSRDANGGAVAPRALPRGGRSAWPHRGCRLGSDMACECVIEGFAEEGRAFREARRWVRSVREYASARAMTMAGSRKLRLYAATDFRGAWGRPRKVEIASWNGRARGRWRRAAATGTAASRSGWHCRVRRWRRSARFTSTCSPASAS
uniref:Uncharacterized protein n=1 Tax=Setaria viridis TaxID=4556 RepID=A0A4U6WGU3_SETVI|nr:hypothetical protein SEVIR_1G361200v2 [Setaria viridis]